jgi:hypothetical protein
MPKFPRSARFSLLVSPILASCCAHAFCQVSPLDYVPNLPYTAEVVQTEILLRANGTRVKQETRLVEARDSQGRTYIESFESGNTSRPVMVSLYIPLRRQFMQLFPWQKTARVMTFAGTGPIPTHGLNLNAAKTTVENLPGQTIHGIYAEGTRTTQVIPADDGDGSDVVDVQETWVSPDLKVMVLSKHTSTAQGSDQTTTEILRLDRNEPDAAPFEIPTDYTIVKSTAGTR